MARLVCALGILTSCLVGIYAAVGEKKLDAHCSIKSMNNIVNDQSTRTVAELCGDSFWASANGISTVGTGVTWTAKARLTSKDGSFTMEGENPGILGTDLDSTEDVTQFFTNIPPIIIDVPQTECDNIVMVARLSFEGSDGTVFATATTTRLWCDFSGVNFALTSSSVNPPITTVSTDNNLVLPSNVQVTPSVTGTLPTLANDGCYRVAAFLTRDTPGDCTLGDDYSADVKYEDVVIPDVRCFKTNTELSSVDLQSIVTGFTVPSGLCGKFYLVILLDALHSAGTEPKRCDNHVAFEYNIDCTTDTSGTPDGQCQLVHNPWSLDDLRVIFHENTGTYRMYSHRDDHWETRRMGDMSDMEVYGYGSLKVLAAALEPEVQTCETAGSFDATAGLNTLEGQNEENIFDVSLITELGALVSQYTTEKGKIEQLNVDSSTATQVATDAYNNWNTEMTNNPTDFMGKLEHMIKMAAYNATMFVATTRFVNNDEYTVKDIVATFECHLGYFLEHFFHVDKELFDPANTLGTDSKMDHERTVIEMVGNFTLATLIFKSVHPDFTCLEHVYYNMLYYIKHRADPNSQVDVTLDWAFDKEIRENVMLQAPMEEDRMMHCDYHRRLNKCMKKMMSTCSEHRWSCDYQDLTPADVCRAKTLANHARTHWSAMGLHHINKMYVEEREMDGDHDGHDDKTCDGEPLMPKRNPMQLWKYVPGTTSMPHDAVMRGFLSIDNKKVCWKKVALCTCDHCDPTTTTMRRKRK